MEKHKDFNLPRFFKIFSLVIILSISTILSFVIAMHQKNQIIEHSALMANLYADILHYEIDNIYNFTLDKYGIFRTIDKDFIKSAELDKITRAFIERFDDIFKIKIYDRAGIVVYSTDKDDIGEKTDSNAFKMALENKIGSKLTKKNNPLEDITEKGNTYKLDILEVYIPMMSEIGRAHV